MPSKSHHVSKLIWTLAFVHPPWASSCRAMPMVVKINARSIYHYIVKSLIHWTGVLLTSHDESTILAIALPVVPHKAVAEVSKIGNYRRCEILWCMDGRANPLMDRKVVEALSLSLNFSLSLYLSLCLSICLSLFSVIVVVVVAVIVVVSNCSCSCSLEQL